MSTFAARLNSRRFTRTLPWISGLVLVAGAIAFLVAYLGNTAHVQHAGFRPGKVQVPAKAQPTVKLDPAARKVAGDYITTAATRQNLAKAWTMTAPALKQGLTRKEWLKGNIPVQYFPPNAIAGASFRVDESHPRSAMLEVYLFTKPKSGIAPIAYFVGLEAVGHGKSKRWLVNYFAPHYSPPVPANGSNY